MVQVLEEVGEQQRGHLAHEDVAELLADGHARADGGGRVVHDVGQGHDVALERNAGGLEKRHFAQFRVLKTVRKMFYLVDFVEDLLHVLHAVGVGDDVEGHGHGGVDQDPF